MTLLTSVAKTTYLKTFELGNFRLFSKLDLTLDQDLTVFVAPNGAGKSSILDAIALSLRYFVDNLRGASVSHGFDATDMRLVRAESGAMVEMPSTFFVATGMVDARLTVWGRELGALGGKTTYVNAKDLLDRASGLKRDLADFATGRRAHPPELPAIAYYGTGRLWRELKTTELKKLSAENLAMFAGGYVDCLEPASSFGQFSVWFERIVREAQDEKESGIASPHQPQALLAGVRTAIDAVVEPLTGWSWLNWSFVSAEMVLQHKELGRLPFKLLSDGIRSMITLVGDLAHRCVRLNPHFGEEAAARTPGIVLIDEVDMHLHPEWQQVVIQSLQAAFPRIQFIVTTHSPQVLSTVDNRCIRVLHADGTVTTPPRQTKGVESPDVLAAVMGVNPIPPVEEAQWVRDYQALIDQDRGETGEALDLRGKIVAHFGEQHPVVADCDRMLRWQKFKLNRKPGQ